MSTYKIIDLHPTDPDSLGNHFSRANAIYNPSPPGSAPTGSLIVGDSSGHAVAWNALDNNDQAFVMTDLDPEGKWGNTSLALSVNKVSGDFIVRGRVVGSSVGPLLTPSGHAFYCDFGFFDEDLPSLIDLTTSSSGYDQVFARGINDAGVIVGHLRALATLLTIPVLWNPTTPVSGPVLLPMPPGASGEGRATAINSGMTIVGQYKDPTTGYLRACRWDWDTMTSNWLSPKELLPALDPTKKHTSFNESYAWAINSNSTIIVGASGNDIQGVKNTYPCMWRDGAELGGQPAKLLWQNKSPQGFAWGVNTSGKIVGITYKKATPYHAFFYDSTDPNYTDPVYPLDMLQDPKGFDVIVGLRSINDAGEVVGVGGVANGDAHALLMIPM
jgi:hypothetical protein